MQAFYCLLFSIALLLAARRISCAQNRIYLRDYTEINARAVRVSMLTVRYFDSASPAVLHVISTKEVRKVIFQDGRIWQPLIQPPRYSEQYWAEKKRLAAEQKKWNERQKEDFRKNGRPNVLTLNFPAYINISAYPGVNVGLEYEHFVSRKGTYSTSLSVNRYWAGTFAFGELSNGEERANLQGTFLCPGFFYHPAGNKGQVDIAIGAQLPLGTLKRTNTYQPPRYDPVTQHILAAALLQLNITFHSSKGFLLTTYGGYGPMLAAGRTFGGIVQGGIKIGSRF